MVAFFYIRLYFDQMEILNTKSKNFDKIIFLIILSALLFSIFFIGPLVSGDTPHYDNQSKLLLEHMELGDGHIMKNGTIRYDTSSIQLANDYQQLCLHAGYSANLYLKYESGHESIVKSKNEIIKQNVDAWRLTKITKQILTKLLS